MSKINVSIPKIIVKILIIYVININRLQADFFKDISHLIENNIPRLSYGVAVTDIDDDDKFDSLINIGPHEFTVKFYTGEITLKVTGNFGVVSYYIKNKGYMGGQKRLKFSELCLINGESSN